MSVKKRTIKLEQDTEFRFEIEHKDAKLKITLLSGFAEMFGSELTNRKAYSFTAGAKAAVFTYHGCKLEVRGQTEVDYISIETPMVQYINCHQGLEQMRVAAEKKAERGPVAMVVGPANVGKSTFSRILLNYAVRVNRRPTFVELDVDQGSISIPGTVSSTIIDFPADVETGFSQVAPLVYHFGYNSQASNTVLYSEVVKKMAEKVLGSFNRLNQAKYSGVIINTGGWVKGAGYTQLIQTARSFDVNVIFVLDQELLHNQLRRDMPLSVAVVLLPKSSGIAERCDEERRQARDQRVKDYFYGSRISLRPFSFKVKFEDVKVYKIGVSLLPVSCLPIGVSVLDNLKKLVLVAPNDSLKHHILGVTFAKNGEEYVHGTPIRGFICVTDVDMAQKTMMVLSPKPHPLPASILLLSEMQFVESHV